jgi:hypothetical protein
VETCSKCQRRKVIDYRVEPEGAWKTVVLTRWRVLCCIVFRCRGRECRYRVHVHRPGSAVVERAASLRNPYKRKRRVCSGDCAPPAFLTQWREGILSSQV